MTTSELTRPKLFPADCLEWGQSACRGPVEYRVSLSPSGRPFPRCDRHWDLRLEEQERISERYPDSPLPPSDFDPGYAGERWDDEY
jgi:hypothetical protein